VESEDLLPCSRCRRLKIRCKAWYSRNKHNLYTFLKVRGKIAELDFRIHDSGKIFVEALCFAAAEGYLGLLEALLDVGANVDGEDNFRFTALCCAALEGTKSTANALVIRGANVNHFVELYRGSAPTGRTPLSFALSKIAINEMEHRQGIQSGASRQGYYVEVAYMLIDAGADLEQRVEWPDWETETIRIVGTAREFINRLNSNSPGEMKLECSNPSSSKKTPSGQ
jgi:ankyrin repeat protein